MQVQHKTTMCWWNKWTFHNDRIFLKNRPSISKTPNTNTFTMVQVRGQVSGQINSLYMTFIRMRRIKLLNRGCNSS